MKHEDARLSDAMPRRGGYALGDIVTDLWGAAPGPEQRPGAAPAPAAFPPVEQFWRAVDAAVDWTDALVRDTPPDALTTGDRWRFYHSQAPAVLAGDLQAYLTVLKTVDPLGDLKPYARGITVGVPDADTLRCRFQVRSRPIWPHPRRRPGGIWRRYPSGRPGTCWLCFPYAGCRWRHAGGSKRCWK